jgi:hypothetical protein
MQDSKPRDGRLEGSNELRWRNFSGQDGAHSGP